MRSPALPLTGYGAYNGEVDKTTRLLFMPRPSSLGLLAHDGGVGSGQATGCLWCPWPALAIWVANNLFLVSYHRFFWGVSSYVVSCMYDKRQRALALYNSQYILKVRLSYVTSKFPRIESFESPVMPVACFEHVRKRHKKTTTRLTVTL